jgi:hypothetical protein
VNSSTQTSPLESLGLLIFLGLMIYLVRVGKRETQHITLAKGERARPLLITVLDPLVSLVIIGGYVWRLVSSSAWHVVGALVGVIGGIVFGYVRAREITQIGESLSGSPVLAPLVREVPGRRLPGAIDPESMTLRAVLGQQDLDSGRGNGRGSTECGGRGRDRPRRSHPSFSDPGTSSRGARRGVAHAR